MDPSNNNVQHALKVADAARLCQSHAVTLSSAVTANGSNGAIVRNENEYENPNDSACATAVGNKNIITTTGQQANIFNILVSPETSSSTTTQTAHEDHIPASYPHIHFNERVLWCLAKNLTDHQLYHIKILLCKETDSEFGLSRDQIGSIQTTEHLMNILQDNKLLSLNNTWFLQFLVFCARNKKIYKGILDFMVERMTEEHPVCVYEPLELIGSVQLKVAGDIEHFLNIDVEAFRQILCENCGSMVRYTDLRGITNGCVMLTFQIPSNCKDVLLDDARNNAEWLTSNGIFQVCIDGQEPVNIHKCAQQRPSPAQDRANLLLSILTCELKYREGHTPSKELINSAVGGKPFLHWACELNKTKWVQFLLDHGADVNATDEMGCTILHKVAFLGLPELCKTLLLTEGIHRFAEDKDKLTPLIIAKEEGHEEIVKLFQVFEDVRKDKEESERRIMEAKKEIQCLEKRLKYAEASMKKSSKLLEKQLSLPPQQYQVRQQFLKQGWLKQQQQELMMLEHRIMVLQQLQENGASLTPEQMLALDQLQQGHWLMQQDLSMIDSKFSNEIHQQEPEELELSTSEVY